MRLRICVYCFVINFNFRKVGPAKVSRTIFAIYVDAADLGSTFILSSASLI